MLKLPLPLSELVQIGVQVLMGAAKLVVVNKYTVPAPEFVAEIVRVVPEMTGLALNFK